MWSPTHTGPQLTNPTPQPPPGLAHPRAPAHLPRPHPPPPPGFPAQTITATPNAPHSPDPTYATAPLGAPAPTLLDRLFDYDLIEDDYRPDPRDRETRRGDPCPTDDNDPPHDIDSKAFLDLFLEEALSLSREKEILEEYLLK